MILKRLTVGKGLQAYRLFWQQPSAPLPVRETPALTSDEVHRVFYDRLMIASEKVARHAAPATPASPPVLSSGFHA
jgi:hypothetical protein